MVTGGFMKQNLRLLTAIREKGMRQHEFSEKVGDHFTFVSRVINGWINLDENRKENYAKVLGKKKEELFE